MEVSGEPTVPMLTLKQVVKRFADQVALGPLDLDIPRAQTMALVGPSGCGKSTLLRLLLGLIQPDSGTVQFKGRPLTGDDILTLRHEIGYVIQDGGLFPHLTARGNLALLANHLGWSPERQAERIEVLRALTHLPEDGLERYPRELSGGQRQRVALMRALMLDPEVLLLDEPLGALDPLIRSELQADLRDIFQSLEKTVVIVTHDMGEAAYLADEIVLMRGGAIVQQGTIGQFLENPADPFVTQFVNAGRSPLDEVPV